MSKLGVLIFSFLMLFGGCGRSLHGDASAGPKPGGGLYGAPNIHIGRINP